jgi:hypothetical protein
MAFYRYQLVYQISLDIGEISCEKISVADPDPNPNPDLHVFDFLSLKMM